MIGFQKHTNKIKNKNPFERTKAEIYEMNSEIAPETTRTQK